VLLRPSDFDLWLDLKIQGPADLKHLYQPYPAELLQQWPVSTLVNSPAHQSPECIQKISVD
jgi:putative SOS response-associated peptidase YedK